VEACRVLNPTLSARFATSCGAFAPLEFAVDSLDGQGATTGTLQQPYALIGSDPACDICLSSPEIEPFAVFLQVIGGQVFVGDLGTHSGVHWPYGRHPYGWMNPEEPIRIGSFQLRLLAPLSPHPAPFGPTFHPMVAGPDVPVGLPPVEIEFRTGLADRARWTVNRVLTLVGVHTPDGLWVVNLGLHYPITLNGDPIRFARLSESDELGVGHFVIACTYPNPMDDDGIVSFDDIPRTVPRQPLSNQSSTRSTRRPPGFDIPAPSRQSIHRASTKTDFDAEVPPPYAGDPEPADWNADEPTDNPAALSSTREPLPQSPLPQTPLPQLYNSDPDECSPIGLETDYDESPEILVGKLLAATGSSAALPRPSEVLPVNLLRTAVVPVQTVPTPLPNTGMDAMMPILRQLGEMQGHMFAQFQQSLTMMMQMFGQMHREQMGSVQQELARMGEVTTELAKLQTEMLKAREATTPPPVEPTEPEYVNPLPAPEEVPGMTEETAQQHDLVWQRMNQLNEERQTIWKRISGMLNIKSNGAM
jgi:hypothetical protein